MSVASVSETLRRHRDFFASGATRPLEYRLACLGRLEAALRANEKAIFAALRNDLGRSDTDSYLGELGVLYEELRFARKHLARWMRPRRVSTPLAAAIGKSRIHFEPLGVVLVISPWNYPLQLALTPLVGAIAAGNAAVVKPSELAPHTAAVLSRIVTEAFDPRHVSVIEGGVEVSTALLAERFDHIFFTGSTPVGRVVMTAAAKHLTPVTLELGGKSPCLVDDSADIEVTARRLTWGKFFNAGQTCVAPDYVLVSRNAKGPLIEAIGRNVRAFFGEDPAKAPDYARIINARHFERLSGMLGEGKPVLGGQADAGSRYIAPTVLVDVARGGRLMGEEIFGPLLPVLEFDDIGQAIAEVNSRPKPLALYLFTRDDRQKERVLRDVSFGGGCVNDVLIHLSNPKLPFGGVGESGMGAYHGQYSFELFSHRKSVLEKSWWPDPGIRYPPHPAGRMGLVRRLLGGAL